ncbi:m-AAA protease-interacting protein 1, mitochondrial isoform 1-T1 [Synchiropus picturatus]
MQRIASLAWCRELGCLAAVTPALCTRCFGSSSSVAAPVTRRQRSLLWPHASRRTGEFTGQKLRHLSSRSSGPDRGVSVVGIPDPLTWIRCKVIMYLVLLYFELDLTSEEFERGVKQALVHVSDLISKGQYWHLRGVVSIETIEYVEGKCSSLTEAQRKLLAVNMDDIIFLLPEDVTVVFDSHGRKFCRVVMRFWLLSTHDGPDDPEGTAIFRVAPSEDGSPQKKLATAVYEFHRELTPGASPDWTVTTIWHWHWKLAE